jgi:hypothetical protein
MSVLAPPAVAIAALFGPTGLAGRELMRLLASHPRMRAVACAADTRAPDRCDLVLLALAHGVSGEVGRELAGARVPVIDLSADLRGEWQYGLPELHRVPEARAAARGVAENVLVKCALHGGDPNWGRILAALGAAGVRLEPDRVSVAVGGVPIVAGGGGIDGTMPSARQQLSKDEVEVEISLGWEPDVTVIASDLSPDLRPVQALADGVRRVRIASGSELRRW